MANGKSRKKDSARLTWDTKPRRAPNPRDIEFQTAEVVIPNPHREEAQLPLSFRDGLFGEEEIDKQKMNRLIWGDNLLAMQALLSQGYEGKINLIYIDPPFDSKADYSHKMTIAPSVIPAEAGIQDFEFTKEPSVIERLAYKDTWAGGTDSYLDMLYPRFQLMKRLLAEDGSIFVHLDWHVGHYVKVMMDEVFGKENFLNEIIWKRADSHNDPSRLGIVDDRIYLYAKSEKYKFNPIYKEYSKNYLDSFYNHIEPETGRRYRLDHFTKPKGSLGYFYTYKGCEPPPNGWRCPIETMEKWDKMGILVVKSKKIYKKKYLN